MKPQLIQRTHLALTLVNVLRIRPACTPMYARNMHVNDPNKPAIYNFFYSRKWAELCLVTFWVVIHVGFVHFHASGVRVQVVPENLAVDVPRSATCAVFVFAFALQATRPKIALSTPGNVEFESYHEVDGKHNEHYNPLDGGVQQVLDNRQERILDKAKYFFLSRIKICHKKMISKLYFVHCRSSLGQAGFYDSNN